jgi:hypothetical protein
VRGWPQVDTGVGEPAKLPIQEMPINPVGQGRRKDVERSRAILRAAGESAVEMSEPNPPRPSP